MSEVLIKDNDYEAVIYVSDNGICFTGLKW
jgi:hypothetical protein